MPYCIKAFVKLEDGGYSAECLEVDATATGPTLDETVDRLRAEVSRRLEGADLAALGLEPDPKLFITFEDVPIITQPDEGCRCRRLRLQEEGA